jgi:hypothetical protein
MFHFFFKSGFWILFWKKKRKFGKSTYRYTYTVPGTLLSVENGSCQRAVLITDGHVHVRLRSMFDSHLMDAFNFSIINHTVTQSRPSSSYYYPQFRQIESMNANSNGVPFHWFLLVFAAITSHVSSLMLTPSTTPEQIIQSQLAAFQQNDMPGVFRFASPRNKAQFGGDVNRFENMINRGPYQILVNHSKAEILLQSSLAQSQQYLVRVIPADYPRKASIQEYWWSLSRCRAQGPDAGCYMVDAVLPNA